MNNQEIFDTVATRLTAQRVQSRGRSTNPSGTVCKYRGHDNTKCAIGCLIPDELYDPILEGRAVRSFFHPPTVKAPNHPNFDPLYDLDPQGGLKYEAVTKSIVDYLGIVVGDLYFLDDLQRAHDRHFDTIEMLHIQLRTVAAKNALNTAVLDALETGTGTTPNE
jgi:hypothetical protein